MSRLYEQGADSVRIGKYVRNWRKWVRAGVKLETKGFIPSNGACSLFFLFFPFLPTAYCHLPTDYRRSPLLVNGKTVAVPICMYIY